MAAAGALLDLLKTTATLARTRLGPVALAALAPFVASHLVVLQARRIGMPERLVLDAVHGVIVLSYLGAAVRVAQGRAVGAARVGLAWPRVRWPGWGAIVKMTAAVVIIGLPVALLLHPLTRAVEAWAAQAAGAWIAVPTVMIPEYVMTALVALVLAGETAKMPDAAKP